MQFNVSSAFWESFIFCPSTMGMGNIFFIKTGIDFVIRNEAEEQVDHVIYAVYHLGLPDTRRWPEIYCLFWRWPFLLWAWSPVWKQDMNLN